jgi:hypothetical protein
MRRTMFEAGFSSPSNAYGLQFREMGRLPSLEMGSLWSDIKGIFTAPPKPTAPATPPPPPVPQPSGTILGIPTDYVVIGASVALILGIVAAVAGSRKTQGPPPVPPRPQVGRRHRRR